MPTDATAATTTPRKGRLARAASWLAWVVTALFVAMMLLSVLSDSTTRRAGRSVAGTVESHDGGRLTVSYRLGGTSYRDDVAARGDYRDGERVELRVDPDHPDDAVLATGSLAGDLALNWFVVPLAAIGVWVGLVLRWMGRRPEVGQGTGGFQLGGLREVDAAITAAPVPGGPVLGPAGPAVEPGGQVRYQGRKSQFAAVVMAAVATCFFPAMPVLVALTEEVDGAWVGAVPFGLVAAGVLWAVTLSPWVAFRVKVVVCDTGVFVFSTFGKLLSSVPTTEVGFVEHIPAEGQGMVAAQMSKRIPGPDGVVRSLSWRPALVDARWPSRAGYVAVFPSTVRDVLLFDARDQRLAEALMSLDPRRV